MSVSRAVVTGGASGLGAVIVRSLAGLGAQVLIADRDQAGAMRLAADLKDSGVQPSRSTRQARYVIDPSAGDPAVEESGHRSMAALRQGPRRIGAQPPGGSGAASGATVGSPG